MTFGLPPSHLGIVKASFASALGLSSVVSALTAPSVAGQARNDEGGASERTCAKKYIIAKIFVRISRAEPDPSKMPSSKQQTVVHFGKDVR